MDWIDFNSTNFQPEIVIKTWRKDTNPLKSGVASFLSEWFDDSEYIQVQSSGTTGTVHSFKVLKEHMIESALMTSSFFDFQKGDKALLCLSTNFIAGKMMLVRSIVSELKLAIGTLDANPLKELKERIDFCPMVPLQVSNSMSEIHLVDKLLIGGVALHEDLEKQIVSIHPNAFMSFGMAETLSHIAMRKLGAEKGVFQVLDHVDVHSNDDDCLVITAAKIGVEGLCTKDLIEMVDENSFRWLGRMDNLINSGGVKVVPEIIEDVIKDLMPNKFYFIGGIPDDKLGQKVVLIIESKESTREKIYLTRENLLKLGLSNYQIPKEVFIIREFARTESEKIKRKYILDNLKNQEILVQHSL